MPVCGCSKMFKGLLSGLKENEYMKSTTRRSSHDKKDKEDFRKDTIWWKTMAVKMAIPMLGVLFWVFSIHSGTSIVASFIPHYLTDFNINAVLPQEEKARSSVLKISEKDLNSAVEFGQSVVDHLQRLENSLGWSNIEVHRESPAHGQVIESAPENEALNLGRDALIATKATVNLMTINCDKHHLSPSECARHITNFKLTSTPLRTSCPTLRKVCSQSELKSPYRTIDGSCNHPSNGIVGQSYTAYKRLLFPNYLDGVQELRSRSVNRRYSLPSPRAISTSISRNVNTVDNQMTLAVMQWSQFIEHDLAHTPTHKMIHSRRNIECCTADGSNLSPRHKHPFCEPIQVPYDDEFYSKHGIECMTYVRSIPAMRSDCSLGPMEQMNQATHYLDGSQIYGSNFKKSLSLRTMEGGLLEFSQFGNHSYLPISKHPSEDCQIGSESICFKSGDSRVNLQPQLTAMYTIWLREHNRVATILQDINPLWDDEMLYQEARRIVVAEMQHITYNEWLPVVLGNRYASEINSRDNFSDKIDPSVSNSFATAALRFLNSLMEGNLKLYKENRSSNSSIVLSQFFNKPDILERSGFMDSLVRGLATQASQKMDLDIIDDVTTLLYRTGEYGYDVLSLDIQRGRDHGLPGYTAFRSLCGLPSADNFDDLSDAIPLRTIQILKSIYNDPRDIDLLVGGLSERPAKDSLLGPTFNCIISDQMWRTKHGDRYFYTNLHQPKPFTTAQLNQLKKATLARIFCDNGGDIRTMQPNAFKKIDISNSLVDCSRPNIPRVDLTFWAENYTLFA